MYRHFVFNLQGLTKDCFSLSDDKFDKNQCIDKWKSIHFLPGLATYNVLKAQLLLLYEDEAQALVIASLWDYFAQLGIAPL